MGHPSFSVNLFVTPLVLLSFGIVCVLLILILSSILASLLYYICTLYTTQRYLFRFALWWLYCLMFVKSLHIFFYVNSRVSKNCGRCTPYRCLFMVIYWHCCRLTLWCDALWSCVYSPDLFFVLLLHPVFFGHLLFVQLVVIGHFCNLF